ncbi:alpha-amylase family glycosyl hydrolase [Lactobacillus intestinalis]|uniref:alpha-amylase family glycosyl hydrolase n=1 Tax=Lactobacillus intestinalis TaxID=151781 RepID=UPI001F598100|nr:alpha-amylase family glycosyl hydrolase [Lactobacillus intestinalis]
MNYSARNFVVSLLTKDDQIKAEDKFSQLVENYPSAFLKNCLNNIGTHDTERIKTVLHGNENLVAIAFGLLMMLPGVPCIYYGDEAGLIGKRTLIIAASFHGHVRVNF